MKKFGFVVPVYKTEKKYLLKCVNSILRQTYTDIELVLVDDCSPDDCGAICDSIAKNDARVKVVHHTVNKGLPGARNTGMDNIDSEWVVFIDSDDWIELDMCEKILNYLDALEADIFFYSGFRNYGKEQIECNYHFPDMCIFSSYEERERLQKRIFLDQTKDCVEGAAPIQQAGFKIYKVSFLKEKQIKFTNIRFSEDALMHMNSLELAEKVVYLQQRFYHYRDTPNSMVNSFRNNADIEQLSAIRAMWNFANKHNKGKEFRKLMYIFSFMSMQMCVWQKYFNPMNTVPKCQRVNQCKELFSRKPYCHTLSVLRKLPIRYLRHNQIIKYYLMKYRLYSVMVYLRTKANKR